MKKMTKEEFIDKSKKIYGNKYDYSKVEYNGNKIPVILIFNEIEYTQRPDSHLQGKCVEKEWKRNYGLDGFLTKARLRHGDKYDYSKVVYTRVNQKIIIICSKHGSFKQKAEAHVKGNGCPTCKESNGEKDISNFLINYNINFETQYSFEDCRNKNVLLFDFYLPDYNMCIEYDGRQHFKINEFFGGKVAFEKLQINDNIKTNYCKYNNIILLRIKYTDHRNIENILYEYFKSKNQISQHMKNEKFIEKAINKWGYKYSYEKVNYIDSRTPIIITYKGIDFKQTPAKHLSGKLCELSNNALSKEEFIRRSRLIWGNRFNYDETTYINSYSHITIFDTYQNIYVSQKADSHMNGIKCNTSISSFIERSKFIYNNKYSYDLVDLSINLCDPTLIICPDHGEFKTTPYNHLNMRLGGICKECSLSKFNYTVTRYLKNKNINFHKQYKFPQIKSETFMLFDFFIPSKNLCIEFSNSEFKDDNLKHKKDFCEDHYIEFIVINDDNLNNIKNIIKNYLI